MRNFLTFLFLAFGVFVLSATAQPVRKSIPGDVTAIDAQGSKITLKTADGEVAVMFASNTNFKRIAPDKLSDPRSAVASSLSEIGVGDKIVAVGVLSDDKKILAGATTIFLLKQEDLAKKQEADRDKWNTRGIAGRVTALNTAGNEITVTMRGGMGAGERTTVVAANDKTVFKRYAPNSVKYSDAKTSSLAEVKVGDQLRAVGERSADNARLTAEEVVFGSFRTVAGKIETIDAAKREVTIKDLQTNKSVTVQVNDETLLRRFPAEMAQRMAQFQAMRAGGQMPPGANGQGGQTPPQRTAGAEGGNPAGRPQGMGGGTGRGDIDSMLERMPALTLTELKVGDAIAANSSVGASADRVTAIKFVAGIEPFLTVPQAAAGNGRPQSSPQINIPGLDGFGAP